MHWTSIPTPACTLQVTDGTLTVGSGTPDTYTFTVTNNGTSTVTSSPITDTQPAGFAITACSATVTTNCGWTCTATGGSTCGAAKAANGVTTVNTTATIPAAGTVTYTIYGKTTAATGTNSTYTVTAGIPTGQDETVPFDNVGADTDFVTGTTFAFTATKSGNGDGLLTVNPGNVRCDVGCTAGVSATYGQNEQIAVWAVPALGDTFAGWTSGACSGTRTVPCVTTVAAATSMNASFVAPTVATSILSTSNGTSMTTVRPGDTETATFTVTVPNGENAPLVITDTLGAGLTLTGTATPATTNLPTCSTSAVCAPAVATNGNVDTWDFGIVTCSNPNGCTITISETAVVGTGATPVRGTTLTQTIGATGGGSAVASTTVIEPNVTVSHSESATGAVAPGATETISVSVSNTTGGSNSDAFDTVVTSPYPASTTAQNFNAGTCTGATATGTGVGSATSKVTVAFPVPGSLGDAFSCTYTYDLVVATAAPAGSLALGADTATSRSTGGTAYRTYTATDTALAIDVLFPVGHACTVAASCANDICDPTDHECGYANGDGTCTPASAATSCQGGSCSSDGVCKAAGKCAADDDCTTAEYCNTGAGLGNGTCAPKLDNGVAIPTVAFHLAPVLAGLCTSASGPGSVGASVCSSGICDPADNKCGLPNGALPAGTTCTVSTDPAALTECRAGFCVTATGSANVGRCEACIDDTTTTCASPTAACDPATNQCVACTGTNNAACAGSTPICNTASDVCAACNGDSGSGASLACGASAPYCNTDPTSGGSCGTSCFADADCATGSWCDAGACTTKLANGTAIPTVAGHAPVLAGACSVAVATAICASGVCDAAHNTCGYDLGDGPCAATTQCTTGTCVASGTNATKCESCTDDSACGGATPVCNTTTGSCAQCDAANTSACTGTTPICNTTTDTCGACNGDHGSSATAACPATSSNCNASGSCTTSCSMDSECGSSAWCDAGTCTPKLANGTQIPAVTGHSPALAGTCSTVVAAAVCQSGVCDPATNDCGFALGDGPCTGEGQCVSGACAFSGSTMVCTAPGVGPDAGAATPNVTVLGGGCATGSGRTNDASNGALFGAAFAALAFFRGRARRRQRAPSSSSSDVRTGS